MALFGVGTTLKAPFPGVKWDPSTGKVLAKNEAWDALSSSARDQALNMPAWDFLHEGERIWSKYVVEQSEQIEVFFLLPAEAYHDVIQRLEKAQAEAKALREQLHAFVQNVPLPLFVVTEDSSAASPRVTFANNLLLELLHLPLRRLYEGLTLEDILGESLEEGQALLAQARLARAPVQKVIERSMGESTRYWLIRLFPFQSPSLQGIMGGIIDLTKEKQQEQRLAEAYQELQAQAEELRQNQEELLAVNEALEAARQEAEMRRRELEDSLRAAQRYQRTLLFRTRTLQEGWGYDQVSAVTRPHTYIGGDFLIGKRVGEWLYVGIGDATGHGSSGALLAVTVQLLLHQFLLQLSSPEHLHQVLEEVRQELVELWGIHLGEQLSNEGAEVALVALPLSRSKDYLYVATAGRPAYILRRNGEVEEYLQGRRPLGWSAPGQPPETYFTQEIPYPAEATLFLFTDGVTDQLSLNGKRLGRRTFLSWIGETASLTGDPRAQTRHLMQKWHAWKSDIVEQTDDILLLAVAL